MVTSFFQLHIPKRTGHCAKGSERLLPGMEYYSLLLEQEDETVVRKDFCLACWSQVTKEERLLALTHWKSRIEKKSPEPLKTRPLRALALIKELIKQAEASEAEIFVLALYLAHARQLILRQEIEQEGQLYLLYEVARQDEFLTIKKVDLSKLETEDIQKSLAEKLK